MVNVKVMMKNVLLSYSDVIFILSYNVQYTITIITFSMLYCKRCSLYCAFTNTNTKITFAEEAWPKILMFLSTLLWGTTQAYRYAVVLRTWAVVPQYVILINRCTPYITKHAFYVSVDTFIIT